MPFSQVFPRSLTAPVIRAFAPALPGVFGVSNAARWLYIGETDNIQEALLAYCQEPPSGNTPNRPSGFVFEVCDRSSRSARQTRLIAEYSPSGNARRGRRP